MKKKSCQHKRLEGAGIRFRGWKKPPQEIALCLDCEKLVPIKRERKSR